MTALLAALVLQVAPIFFPLPPAEYPGPPRVCRTARVTGYVRTDPAMNARTYDGTPIRTPEAIAAASRDIPLQSRVEVEGIGTFRVADRGGGLLPTHVDVAVWSVEEARSLTSTRTVCWWSQEDP